MSERELALSASLTISSARLALPLLSPAFLAARIAVDGEGARNLVEFEVPDAWFGDDDTEFFKMRRDQSLQQDGWAPWLLRAIVWTEQNVMVGYINFHGPPGINDLGRMGAAELGYEIFPRFRRRGFATEAACALLAWAREAHGVKHFISAVLPDNAASLAVNRKLGFLPTGTVVEGELIFELLVE